MNNHTPATFLGQFLGRPRQWPSFFWQLEARLKGVEFEGRCEFLGRPLISLAKGGGITLGDRVRIYSALRANPLGCFQPCVLRAMAPGARLVLARGVGLGGTVMRSARPI